MSNLAKDLKKGMQSGRQFKPRTSEDDQAWASAPPFIKGEVIIDIVPRDADGVNRSQPLKITAKEDKTVIIDGKEVAIPAHLHVGWPFSQNCVMNCHFYGFTEEEVRFGVVGHASSSSGVRKTDRQEDDQARRQRRRTRVALRLGQRRGRFRGP